MSEHRISQLETRMDRAENDIRGLSTTQAHQDGAMEEFRRSLESTLQRLEKGMEVVGRAISGRVTMAYLSGGMGLLIGLLTLSYMVAHHGQKP